MPDCLDAGAVRKAKIEGSCHIPMQPVGGSGNISDPDLKDNCLFHNLGAFFDLQALDQPTRKLRHFRWRGNYPSGPNNFNPPG